MPSTANSSKRSAPVPTPQVSNKSTGGPKSSKSNNKTPKGSPNHPQLAGAPMTDPLKTTKKVSKAVRGAKGGKTGKGSGKTKVGDGPEAELSDDESDASDGTTPEPEARVLVDVGNNIENTPATGEKKEVSMQTLIAGAKVRVDHNISRGYEFIPSPASRLIIPLDSTHPAVLSKLGVVRRRGDSLASSLCLSDESEWESVHWDMDGDQTEGEGSGAKNGGGAGAVKKRAYAEVVRGLEGGRLAAASA